MEKGQTKFNKARTKVLKLFSKKPHFELPFEIWHDIGSYLVTAQDYLHLAAVNRVTYSALADKTLLDRFAPPPMASFPLFEEKNPFENLANLHNFKCANGEPQPHDLTVWLEELGQEITLPNIIKYIQTSEPITNYALGADGKIYGWGCVQSSILEKNEWPKDLRPSPIKCDLTDKNIIDVVIGDTSTAALSSQGQIFLWGVCHFPDSDAWNIKKPRLVKDSLENKKIIAIRAGNRHYLMLSSNGEVFIWGTSDKKVQCFAGPWKSQRIIGIEAASFHSLALTKQGILYGWGDNSDFQLGLNEPIIYKEPQPFNRFKDQQIISIRRGKLCHFILTKKGQVLRLVPKSNNTPQLDAEDELKNKNIVEFVLNYYKKLEVDSDDDS